LFFGFNDLLQTVDFVVIESAQVGFTCQVIVPLLLQLVFVEVCQLLDALVVFYVVLFLLHTHFPLFTHQTVQVVFVFFASLSQSAAQFVGFSLSFFKFVAQSLQFCLVEVLEFFFVFPVSSDEVVFGVFIFSFDHVKFMVFLVFNFLDFVFKERDFSIESFVLELGFTSHIFELKVLFLNFIFKFSNVEFLEFIVAELRSFQSLDLIQSIVFIPVFELADFDLFHVFDVNDLVVESVDFNYKLFNLDLVLMVLDVEVIENFLFLGFGKVGVGVLVVEFLFEGPGFFIFVLEKSDKVFILIDEVCVLCKKELNLILKIVDSLIFPHL
jgi:hypothetical protein